MCFISQNVKKVKKVPDFRVPYFGPRLYLNPSTLSTQVLLAPQLAPKTSVAEHSSMLALVVVGFEHHSV